MINKKKIINYTFKKLHRLISKKKKLLFIAPYVHHAIHLDKVINQLAALPNYSITAIGPFKNDNSKIKCISKEQLKCTDSFDLVITTEFGLIPWWLSAESVFFGHGIGPKTSYQASKGLKFFDYSFCPCQPIFDVQKESGVKIKKVGLPLLDDPEFPDYQAINIKFRLKLGLPLVVYAPSWSSETDLLTNIPFILNKLMKVNDKFNIIISPHPNLLRPDLCGGKQILDEKNSLLLINGESSNFSTFQLCQVADIVISDISSVLFEAISMNKKVFSDGNRHMYQFYGAEPYFDEMSKYVNSINWNVDLASQLLAEVPSTSEFIDRYLFNRGNATESFIKSINDILK